MNDSALLTSAATTANRAAIVVATRSSLDVSEAPTRCLTGDHLARGPAPSRAWNRGAASLSGLIGPQVRVNPSAAAGRQWRTLIG